MGQSTKAKRKVENTTVKASVTALLMPVTSTYEKHARWRTVFGRRHWGLERKNEK
jgi:hypothetical protein